MKVQSFIIDRSQIIKLMKFTVETLLSLPVDGASSHILTFNNTIKVLLDCGISSSFDFRKYLDKIEQLKTVSLVLVSHSTLEYSGALAFLVDQIGLNPKIFYTTQPIMRYSPLNVHEELLNIRSHQYSKKVFNKIYKIYQSINIIKPLQKKCINLFESQNEQIVQEAEPVENNQAMEAQQPKTTVGEVDKEIYFTCFCAGSHMGSLAWRLSFGLVNILYMVEYNNYSLYHINGVNLDQILAPTNIFITDTYRNIDDSWIKKSYLYNKIKDILIRLYERTEKSPIGFSNQGERKIVLTCSPNEMLVEIMAVVKKILEEIQPAENRQKIRVVHLSSRFLQLIKSQMDYFSSYFKDTLQNIQQYFMHSKELSGRINIATFQSLQSLLFNSNNAKPAEIMVYHFGEEISSQQINRMRQEGQSNIPKLKIFTEEKLIHSASKISYEIPEQKEDSEIGKPEGSGSEMSEEKEQTISEVPDEVEIIRDVQTHSHQPLHSKYFSQVGFPRFTSKLKDEQYIFDDYGSRHQFARFSQRMTIEDYKKQLESGNSEPVLQKKNSTIEIMNIEFRVPPTSESKKLNCIQYIPFNSHSTNFTSSIQLITCLKPDHVILVNTDNRREGNETLSNKYQSTFKNRKLENDLKVIKVYDLAPKNYRVLEIENELISYKVNYIPIPQERKLQKVRGLITYSSNGLLYIHLDCLEQKEHLDFRLDKFYKKVKLEETHECIFTKNGLYIDGVRIYRQNKRIILEGCYSEQYFKVRRMLYDFLAMD